MTTKGHVGHIAITGTGRAGTTLLVQFFTALGFDTGYTLEEAMQKVDPLSLAGLEQRLREGKPPHVVKSPWFVDEINHVLESGSPPLEAVVIPIRDLFSAAESRRRVYREARKLGGDPLRQPGTIWKTDNPSAQEAQLAIQLHKLLSPLAENDVPIYLLSFPKFANAPAYLFERLRPLFEKYGKTLPDVRVALKKVVKTDAIHNFKEEMPTEGKRRVNPLPFIESVLGKDLTSSVEWKHGDAAFDDVKGDYYRIWKDIFGGHKKYSYFDLYEKLFAGYRGRPLNVLEIGVYHGASLKAWREYFGPEATIVGADINPVCKRSEDPKTGIHVRIGDQSDTTFLKALIEEFGPFDIVMDDGSHVTAHQLASFKVLFDAGLASPGLYFIEDTNTSLWEEYCKGPHDMFDLAQACALGMNYFYWTHTYVDYIAEKHPRPFEVPLITKLIEEVRIFDSAIAIYKSGTGHYPTLVKHN